MNIDEYLLKIKEIQKFYVEAKPIIDNIKFEDEGILYKDKLHKTPFYADDYFVVKNTSNIIRIIKDGIIIHTEKNSTILFYYEDTAIYLNKNFDISYISLGTNEFYISEEDIGNINSLENLSEDDLFYLYLQKSYA